MVVLSDARIEGVGFCKDIFQFVEFRAQIITHTILGVPCYNYSIMGTKTLF